MEFHRPDDLTTVHLLLIVLKAENPVSRCQQVWFLLKPLSSPSVFMWSSLCVYAYGVPLSLLTRILIILDNGATLLASFLLSHLFKGPISKHSHID